MRPNSRPGDIISNIFNTLLNVSPSTGDHGATLTPFATVTTISIKIEAINPEVTTRFAFFLPYISDIMSVTRKVTG